MTTVDGGLAGTLDATRIEVEAALDHLLPASIDEASTLVDAMRYATLGGGKRLRALLVLASANLFAVSRACAMRVAAAVECVHAYSLVHDDLPAMDDDAVRRGRPTVHVKFDEATAILAGDALLTLAFEILAHPDTHSDPQVRIALTSRLAQASGARGMVGGQMMDMLAGSGSDYDIGSITRLQRLKTGEMFAFACESGAILGKVDKGRRQALHAYAHDLGLAFQITDDLLDVEGQQADVGKALGKDAIAGKATFIRLLGVERARSQASMLAAQAAEHLELFDSRADILRQVARFAVERRY